MSPQWLYTLDQAARVLARRQCAAEGHDLETVMAGSEPIRIACARGCGAGWVVVRAAPSPVPAADAAAGTGAGEAPSPHDEER